MSSKDTTADKLVASIRKTKSAASSTPAVRKKAATKKATPKAAAAKPKPATKPAAKPATKPAAKSKSADTGSGIVYSSGRRVWPD